MALNLTETRAPEIFAVNLVFGILTILIVLLRTYTRAVIVKSFGLDDWIMILATVSAKKNMSTWYKATQIIGPSG